MYYHTAGEWTSVGDTMVYVVQNGQLRQHILSIQQFGLQPLEPEANLQLVAHAPDMLDALERAQHVLNHLANNDICDLTDTDRVRSNLLYVLHQIIDPAISNARWFPWLDRTRRFGWHSNA